MQTRHYELIAAVLRAHPSETTDQIIETLAERFHATQARANRAKWLRACGWKPDRVLSYLKRVL